MIWLAIREEQTAKHDLQQNTHNPMSRIITNVEAKYMRQVYDKKEIKNEQHDP